MNFYECDNLQKMFYFEMVKIFIAVWSADTGYFTSPNQVRRVWLTRAQWNIVAVTHTNHMVSSPSLIVFGILSICFLVSHKKHCDI